MSWLLGFSISGGVWLTLNAVWPPPGLGETDETDVFGTFGSSEFLASENASVKVCDTNPVLETCKPIKQTTTYTCAA